MGSSSHPLTVFDLTVKLGGRTVVDRVSLSVAPGEIVGLLGPNGAGKTTVFRSIMGLLQADGGRVALGEHDLRGTPTHQRARLGLGYLPQDSSLLGGLTAEQNVRLVLQLRGRRATEPRPLLRALGLEDRSGQRVATLSGGERRRLELACLLAADFDVILLDEPFKGLDPLVVVDLAARIRGLAARGAGLLLTDHAVQQTLSICSRTYILADGRVVAAGTPSEIQAQPEAQAVFFGAPCADAARAASAGPTTGPC